MNETSDVVSRRDRGISAYATILAVPEKNVPTTVAELLGPDFAEETLQFAVGPGGDIQRSPRETAASPSSQPWPVKASPTNACASTSS